MRRHWTANRVKAFIERYGQPKEPEPRYGKRMQLIASRKVGDSVLDVACGVGHLRPHLGPGPYLGVDSSQHMIDHARLYFPDDEFQLADAYNLAYLPQVDTVFAASLLIHIEHDEMPHVLYSLFDRARLALVFTIPIDKNQTRIDYPGDPLRETVITHVERETLISQLEATGAQKVELDVFPRGAFGAGLKDYLVRAWRIEP